MKKFKFSLESVLVIRQKTLDEERKKLAKLFNLLNQQEENLKFFQEEHAKLKLGMNDCLTKNINDANLIANYIRYINKQELQIENKKKEIKETNQKILLQQEEVKKAYISVKSLEKLKEKQKEKHNKELLDEECKVIDDIVNSRRIGA